MNDIPKTAEAAGTPSNNWEATAERLFECSATLERDNNRMRWLIRQVVNDLPQKRDWLNPDYEREMRNWANAKCSQPAT